MIYLKMLTPAMMTDHEVAELCNCIWPKPYADAASHATIYDGVHRPTGQIFLICDSKLNGDQIVGLTGYFDVGPTTWLRWTGVLPQFRKQGVFRSAIQLLVMQLRGARPDACRLIELVPANAYGDSIEQPFLNVGFVPCPEANLIPDGEDTDWPVVPYALNW